MSVIPPQKKLLEFMKIAIEEAKASAQKGEVPIGAVVVRGDEVIARAGNEIETRCDATAHAEILAIQAASTRLNNWRLDDCILCVTVEPCTMCAGAIFQARIPVVAFGAFEPKFGAFGSRYDLSHSEPGTVKVISGIQEVESQKLLQDFFKERR